MSCTPSPLLYSNQLPLTGMADLADFDKLGYGQLNPMSLHSTLAWQRPITEQKIERHGWCSWECHCPLVGKPDDNNSQLLYLCSLFLQLFMLHVMLSELNEADRLVRSSDVDATKARQSVCLIVFVMASFQNLWLFPEYVSCQNKFLWVVTYSFQTRMCARIVHMNLMNLFKQMFPSAVA